MSDPNNANETVSDDFLAGFNSDETEGATTGTAAAATATPGNEEGAGGDGGTGTGAVAGDEGGAVGAGAAAGTTAEGVDNQQGGEQVTGQQPPELDLSTLPDNIRQIIEAEREELRVAGETIARQRADFASLHGKLAPTQRRLEELQRQEQSRQVAAQGGAGTGGTAAASALEEAEALFNSPAFLEYAKTWPEEAKLQKESQLSILKAALRQTESLERMISTEIAPQLRELQSDRKRTAHEQALGQLATEHPDWAQHNQSDEFWNWFAKEEPYLNFTSEQHRQQRLNDQGFVSHLLTRYKNETGLTDAGTAQQQNQQQQNQQQQGQQEQVQQQQSQQGSARLALSAAPEIKGGAGPVRQGSTGVSPGDQFLAGFNSD